MKRFIRLLLISRYNTRRRWLIAIASDGLEFFNL